MHYTAREAGAFLGSPAMTGVPYRTIGNKLHDASFDGCWLDNFLTQLAPSNLQGGTVDFICVHWCGRSKLQFAFPTLSECNHKLLYARQSDHPRFPGWSAIVWRKKHEQGSFTTPGFTVNLLDFCPPVPQFCSLAASS